MSNETNKPELSLPVQELKKEILGAIEGENASYKLPKDFYKKHLPEGVTDDILKKISTYNAQVAAAASVALAEKATPEMKKNEELTKGELVIPTLGHEHMSIIYTGVGRGAPGSDEPSYGGLSIKMQSAFNNKNSGELKIAQSICRGIASDAFK